MYAAEALPYNARKLGEKWLVVSSSGDFLFLDDGQIKLLENGQIDRFSLSEQAALKSHFFIRSIDALGSDSLLLSRESARRETVQAGPCLHIIVPTLQCAHSCQYCQVSRSLTDSHHVMSDECLYKACESIFQSEAKALTVEFQGGDPLLRFDMVQAAVLYIKKINLSHHKNIRFVVASTLHQLDESMCFFMREHEVFIH